eukprot:TRINITY_DN4699_c0_g1_i1.p1 TRINITY_DN4699_c0_g1~~TRINITY_DN4699_c0_g1_i1.p1  ORF type:complete len:496 (+),score=98.48 TRINITY_DN4699_c0_g1_i1:48-1535(+)
MSSPKKSWADQVDDPDWLKSSSLLPQLEPQQAGPLDAPVPETPTSKETEPDSGQSASKKVKKKKTMVIKLGSGSVDLLTALQAQTVDRQASLGRQVTTNSRFAATPAQTQRVTLDPSCKSFLERWNTKRAQLLEKDKVRVQKRKQESLRVDFGTAVADRTETQEGPADEEKPSLTVTGILKRNTSNQEEAVNLEVSTALEPVEPPVLVDSEVTETPPQARQQDKVRERAQWQRSQLRIISAIIKDRADGPMQPELLRGTTKERVEEYDKKANVEATEEEDNEEEWELEYEEDDEEEEEEEEATEGGVTDNKAQQAATQLREASQSEDEEEESEDEYAMEELNRPRALPVRQPLARGRPQAQIYQRGRGLPPPQRREPNGDTSSYQKKRYDAGPPAAATETSAPAPEQKRAARNQLGLINRIIATPATAGNASEQPGPRDGTESPATRRPPNDPDRTNAGRRAAFFLRSVETANGTVQRPDAFDNGAPQRQRNQRW